MTFWPQDSESYVPVVLEVVREVEHGNSALTQLTVERLTIGERSPERVQGSHEAALRSGARSNSAGGARRVLPAGGATYLGLSLPGERERLKSEDFEPDEYCGRLHLVFRLCRW